jgi:hypothetical protein
MKCNLSFIVYLGIVSCINFHVFTQNRTETTQRKILLCKYLENIEELFPIVFDQSQSVLKC